VFWSDPQDAPPIKNEYDALKESKRAREASVVRHWSDVLPFDTEPSRQTYLESLEANREEHTRTPYSSSQQAQKERVTEQMEQNIAVKIPSIEAKLRYGDIIQVAWFRGREAACVFLVSSCRRDLTLSCTTDFQAVVLSTLRRTTVIKGFYWRVK